MLESGADVQDRTDDGRTALQFARGDENVNILLQHGADLCLFVCRALAELWPHSLTSQCSSPSKMDSRRAYLDLVRVRARQRLGR